MSVTVIGYVMSCAGDYYIATGEYFKCYTDTKYPWIYPTPEEYFDSIKRKDICNIKE